eukprot:6187438-Ditylum_brightwellii.AAC.1
MEPTLYSSLSATAYNAPSTPTRATLAGNTTSQVRYEDLNMLRPCRLNPKLSAYSCLEGMHDYNAHPVAPFGIEVT